MLNKKLIFLNENFDNTSELFDFVGSKTKELGLSRDNYAANLKKREADFPTALEFNDIGVAIPHADSESLNKEFISLITLNKPLTFRAMENSDKEVKVKIVFVLGLLKANDQLETLQAIVKLLQKESALERLNHASNIKEITSVLNEL
ncbi:hypothetical protein TEH11_1256 [Tetragenococcus halophilus subsp. halophilus]|nr:hypothetical protein TEH11_1256 [Tetragenococcus halophilus subsp. halophilus]